MKQAMILAAGYGKRLRPLTEHTPKPLIVVGGKPLIVWHLERLAAAGVRDIVINHSWLGEKITATLQDGSPWGVHIQYAPEPHPLETATGVKRALPLLKPEPFLLISSDIWCPWPVEALLHASQVLDGNQRLAHLLLVNNPAHHPQGDMYFDPKPYIQPISASAPQPPNGSLSTYTYSGLAVVHPQLFAHCSTTQPTALRVPLHQAMQQRKVTAERLHAPWFDVGTHQRLQALESYLAQNP